MANNHPYLSIVIPVYMTENIIDELVKRISQEVTIITENYEIILVDDGSPDSSWKKIMENCNSDDRVNGVRLSRNYGQHNALLCGIRQAKYDLIVTLDDDLQNPPEEIPKLLEKIDEGYDVVYGYPINEQHGIFRNLASVITKLALKTTMGIATARHVSSFRIFRTALRDSFLDYKGSFVSIDVLLSWGTKSFSAIPVNHEHRVEGKSNYTFRKLVNHAFNMVTGFSVLPLQIASMMGFLLSLFGFGVLVYVVGRYLLEGSPVQGFPFLASIIAIFSGAQLLAIGIIGEYLARIHFRTMDKPQYFIKKTNKTSNY